MFDDLTALEARTRRTGERLTITVVGNLTELSWTRGRGRRATRLSVIDYTLDDMIAALASRIPKEQKP